MAWEAGQSKVADSASHSSTAVQMVASVMAVVQQPLGALKVPEHWQVMDGVPPITHPSAPSSEMVVPLGLATVYPVGVVGNVVANAVHCNAVQPLGASNPPPLPHVTSTTPQYPSAHRRTPSPLAVVPLGLAML